MSLSKNEVRMALLELASGSDPGLDSKSLVRLRAIVKDDDRRFAPLAVCAVAMIDPEDSREVVKLASISRKPAVRAAAAAACEGLDPEVAAPILSRLISSRIPGIRKMAIHSCAKGASERVLSCLDEICQKDDCPDLRALAKRTRREVSSGN